jgi:cytochrome c553
MISTLLFDRSTLRLSLAAAVLAAAPGAAVLAKDPATLQLRALAATCATCHGSDGRAVEGAVVPGLAGLSAGYISEQMKAFKSGARSATVMHQIAKGYSDVQVDQLAAYFEAQPK